MDPSACAPEKIAEALKEQGVEHCFSSYVDLHGRFKGKIVPLSYFDQMVKGSELYTGAAADGVPSTSTTRRYPSAPTSCTGSARWSWRTAARSRASWWRLPSTMRPWSSTTMWSNAP